MCQQNRNRIKSVFVVVCCFFVSSSLGWSNSQRTHLPLTTTRQQQQQSNVSVKVSTSIVQSTSSGPVLVSITGHNKNQQQILPQILSQKETQSDRVIDRARRLTFSNQDALTDYHPKNNNGDNIIRPQQYYHQSSSDRDNYHHGQQQQQQAIHQRPHKQYETTTNITDNKRPIPNAGGRILDLSRLSIVPLTKGSTSGYRQSITTSLNFAPDIRYVIPYISQLNQSPRQQWTPRDSGYVSSAASNIINNNRQSTVANQQINDLNELMYIKKHKQDQQQCQRRGFVGILKAAKSLLSDGLVASTSELTRRASSPGNLLFGSAGLIAAAIPLAVYLMPDGVVGSTIINGAGKRNTGGGADGLSSYSTMALDNGSTISTSYMPILSKFSLQGRVENMMGWIERSTEHLPSLPRLHPQECVKRSICEAYNDPDRYGVVGFALRLLFPATNITVTDRMDDMEYKVINKYRHAAGFGLSRRVENNGTANVAICREKYEDCLISLLDLTEKLIDLFTSSNSIGSNNIEY